MQEIYLKIYILTIKMMIKIFVVPWIQNIIDK